jgi:hypothetical protein
MITGDGQRAMGGEQSDGERYPGLTHIDLILDFWRLTSDFWLRTSDRLTSSC